MKKFKLLIILIIPLMPLIFLGADSSNENAKIISQEEIINNDVFYSGIYLENNGKISGNVFIKAQKSLINGVIEGNAFIYSDTLQLNGHVTGDIFVFSRDIVITGKVDGNIHVLALNSATLETTGEILRNGYIVSDNVFLYSAADSSIAANSVKGEMAAGQFLTFTDSLKSNSFTKVISLFSFIFSNLAVWFILNFIFKKTKIKTAIVLKGNKFKLFFLYGLLSIITGVFAAFLLIMSNVSLAFGLMLMAVVLSLMYLSGGVFIVVLSDYIAETKNILKGGNNIVMVVLLSLVFGLLLMLPIISLAVALVIKIFGFGLLMGSFLIKLKYIEKGQIID